MNAEDGFLAALAQSPDDVLIRHAYADWLEERGDPRAVYLRMRCKVLGVQEEKARRELVERARDLSKPLVDRQWVLFILTQDALCGVMRRCGGPVPSALSVLWRELICERGLVQPDGTNFEIGLYSDEAFGLNGVRRPEFSGVLDRDKGRRVALEEMFREIDFLGDSTGWGDMFGFWRYDREVKPIDAPIIEYAVHRQFSLGGRTLQDFFSFDDHDRVRNPLIGYWDRHDRDNFERARRWWSARGIETSTSLEALAEALTDFPDPQERFEQLCRR